MLSKQILQRGEEKMNGYERLRNAIVVQAVKDYRSSGRKLRKHPDSAEAKKMAGECERFFLSEWFMDLTKVDGQMVLSKLREEVL